MTSDELQVIQNSPIMLNKTKMKKLILFILLFSIASGIQAQHTISGIISDKNDPQKKIEGVSVFIPEFQKYEVSKEGGTYMFRDIGSGTINIQFSGVGYKSVIKTINMKDAETVLHVEMEASTMELEEVTV